jgi:hypothetical protein
MEYSLIKNLPQQLAQLAVRNSWRDSLLTKLAGRSSMDDFCLPLLLNGFQQVGSYFAHAAL